MELHAPWKSFMEQFMEYGILLFVHILFTFCSFFIFVQKYCINIDKIYKKYIKIHVFCALLHADISHHLCGSRS